MNDLPLIRHFDGVVGRRQRHLRDGVAIAAVRTQGFEGVSLATWVLFVYMGCFWMTYGLPPDRRKSSLGAC